MAPGGAPWALVGCALLARAAIAVRGPTPPNADVIGAELLARTAHECDVRAAWRLLQSGSFTPAWLTEQGTGGETPLMAATSAGCSEVVALLMLHPDFDDKTVRKRRLRTAVADHARRSAVAKNFVGEVNWALSVMEHILESKVSQEELSWDPKIATSGDVWYLPQPGEWVPAQTLEEMGMPERRQPDWKRAGIFDGEPGSGIMVTDDGVVLRTDDFDKVWNLLAAFLQSPEGSEEHSAFQKHLRSMGWTNFFFGGRDALLATSYFVAKASRSPDLWNNCSVEDPAHRHIRAAGVDVRTIYRIMPSTLLTVWNETGDWVIAGRKPFKHRSKRGSR